MRIILNADDFGASDEAVRATIECFEGGGLTSATIMAKMPATAGAIDYAKSHPQFSFGVHLTYTSDGPETPMSDPEDIPNLAPNGRFMESLQVRILALKNKIPADQIEGETIAQIEFLHDRGVKISHVDSHCHVHKFGPFMRALRNVLPRFGITKVRIAQDTYLHKHLMSPTFWYGPIWRRRIRKHFTGTEHMFMPRGLEDARQMVNIIPRLKGETIEVGVHPGYCEDWRDAERAGIQQFAKAAHAAGHKLITWNDL